MNVISSWSAGKDSCYALMKAVDLGHVPRVLFNVMNEAGKISRSHGIPQSILEQQSNAMNVSLHAVPASWEAYEKEYISNLLLLKKNYDADGVVFGDIDLEQHREWEEKVCREASLTPLLPLWQQERKQLVFDMIDHGIQAIIVSCNTSLGKDYLGRTITKDIVEEFESIGVDACGENGEYHTLVIDCPLFSSPIQADWGAKLQHENYCFLEWGCHEN